MIELQTILIVSISLAIFAGVWCLDSRNKIVFTPILLLLFNEFLRVMPAFIYAPAIGISKDNVGLLIYFVGFLAVAAGWVVRSGIHRYNSMAPIEYAAKPLIVKSETRVWAGIAAGFLFLFASGVFMYQGVPSVTKALFALAAGDEASTVARDVSSSREQLTKGALFGQTAYRGQGIITIFQQAGWPIITSMAFIAFWKTKKARWVVAASVLLILSFVFIAGNGTRGPFLHSLILYIVLYSFTRPVKARFLLQAFVGLIGIGILISLYSSKMQSKLADPEAPKLLATAILERILIDNAINDVYAIDFVKNGAVPFRYGALQFRDIQAALPGVGAPLPFAHELYLMLNYGGTATTFSTGTYITKAFIDFGIFGVAILFFGVGWLASWWQQKMLRVPKSPLMLATSNRIGYEVGTLVLGGGFISMASTILMILIFYGIVKIGMSLVYAPRTGSSPSLPGTPVGATG